MQSIVVGNIRIQLLAQTLIRLEYGKGGKFCDANTFHIPDRSLFADTEVPYSLEENVLCFGEYALWIPLHGRGLQGIRLEKQGKRVYTYKKLKNSGMLPRPQKTPEVFALADNPRIIVPESGYAPRKNRKTSGYRVQENVQDVYLLLCGGDAKKLRKLYVQLTGRSQMVRRGNLGGWNSKFYAYNEETAKQLILDYQAHGVPLDNMVIDTDWRVAREQGIGYDVNTALFPDLKGFTDFAHSQGVEIMFNDHPEPVEGAKDLLDPREIRYRQEKLQGILAQGVDTWWYDRNWHTCLKSPTQDIPPDTMGMYLFEDITRHFYQQQAGSKTVYRRPLIMANADHVHHGRFWRISNSASHRFSIQWTGDIHSDEDSLAREVENLILCGEQCIPYINADCGGHLGNPGKEWFIRWMQFGTLSPIFRPHCSCFVSPFREPWNYDGETLDIVREYNLLRYRLMPLLYSLAHYSCESGIPMCRSLALAYPGDPKAAACRDQYLLGEDLLIAPVMGKLDAPLGKKQFASPVKVTFYEGTELQGAPLLTKEYKTWAFSGWKQKLEPQLRETKLSARMEATVCPDRDLDLYLVYDDAVTVWVNGQKLTGKKAGWSAEKLPLGLCRAGEDCHITAEYVQEGPEMVCKLCGAKPEPEGRAVYLPEGRWMDVFTGKTYRGNRTIRRSCNLAQMPVFVRLGAVLPLTPAAQNTKQQDWRNLVLDCYPGEAGGRGYLYEDDGETTACQQGIFRISEYALNPVEKGYELRLDRAKGSFQGPETRNIAIRFHCMGAKVSQVTVNGERISFDVVKKDRTAFPIRTEGAAPDGNVALVRFNAASSESQIIRFTLEG